MTNNDIHFILQNSRAKHPAIIQNGLQLYYDAKGKKDTDNKRNTLIDISGNNRHGHLTNFAYKKGSGYQDGLVFDGVDDTLTIPALTNIELVSAGVNTEMKIPQFTYQTNNNIVSFGPEGLVRFVRDGIPYERKGINLVKQLFHQGLKSNWLTGTNITDFRRSSSHFNFTATGNNKARANWVHLNQADLQTIVGHKYLITLELSSKTPEKNIYISHSYYDTQSLQAQPEIQTYYVLLEISDISNNPRFNITGEAGADITFRHFQVVDLTATYGAGNEPTLEAIQQEKEKWVFMPNPQELREAVQLRGNIMGDLENQIDDALVDKVIGTSPIVSTKSVDSVVDVEVQGQSYQLVQTGNANQFNTETDFWHEGGGSFEVVPDTPMGFHLIGGEELGVLSLLRVVKNNGDWTVSFEAKGSGAVSVDICDLGTKNISLTTDWQAFSVTANVTNFNAEWSSFVDFETTNSDVWVRNIKVETGTVKTPEPSPSPENPSPIINMNESFDVVSSVGKENLFTNVRDIEYTGTREFVNSVDWDMAPIIDKYGHDKEYSISFDLKSAVAGDINIYAQNGQGTKYGIGTHVRYATTEYQRFSISFVPSKHNGTTETRALLAFYGQAYGNGKIPTIRNVKMELGSPSKSVLYTSPPSKIEPDTPNPTIYKTNISLSEPLRSVGDIKDKLFRDTDGLWKVERKIGEYKYSGNENFITTGSSGYEGVNSTNRYISVNDILSAPNAEVEISTHFKHHNTVWSADDAVNGGTALNSNQIHTRFPNSLVGISPSDDIPTRTSKIKAFVKSQHEKGTPIIVQYQKRDSTIETLSDDLQQKLNNIQSFNGTNYVYTVDDSGLTPTLHASFKPEAWYKENLLLNSLKIYNRTLTASEMLLNYGTEKERWGL